MLLGKLVASQAYQGMALQLVQRLDVPAANALGELRGQKVGAVAGTLEGTLMATFQGGALVPRMVSMGETRTAGLRWKRPGGCHADAQHRLGRVPQARCR